MHEVEELEHGVEVLREDHAHQRNEEHQLDVVDQAPQRGAPELPSSVRGRPTRRPALLRE